MLECITTMITNLMFDKTGDIPAEEMDFTAIEQRITEEIDDLMDACLTSPCTVYLNRSQVN